MKYLVCVIVFSVVLCELNDFKCGYLDENMESLEFYYGHFNGTVPVNCSPTFTLTKVNDKSRVKNLTISGYVFERNELEEMFQNFTNLNSLDVSYSNNFCIYMALFLHKNLVKFKAIYSKCQYFYLKSLPKLIEMDLSHNNIHTWLRTYKTHPLECIDLSYNLITGQIDNDLIEDFPKLKTLNLENNPIESIDCEILSRVKNGLSIYISWNTTEQLNCIEQHIQAIPNGNVTGLFPSSTSNEGVELHCNEQSFVNVTIYKPTGDNILAVELMKCLIKSLKHLHLYGNFTGKLNEKTFERFLNLEEIEIRTVRLTYFDFAWLKNQKHLKRLLFSKDSLNKMNNLKFLQELKELEYITIMENQLQITANIFEYISSSVKGVSVFGNILGNFTTTYLEKFRKMHFLNLSNMNLSIDVHDLKKIITSIFRLTSCDISYNSLDTGDRRELRYETSNLQKFNASYCKIKNASKLIRMNQPDMTHLRLSGNHLGQVDSSTFDFLPILEYLHLDDMNASNLDIGMLFKLKQLKFLNVSNNNMKTVNLGSTTFQNLEELYLDGNDLESFEDLTKNKFPSLKKLSISKNRFSCDYVSIIWERALYDWDIPIAIVPDPLQQKHGYCTITKNATLKKEQQANMPTGESNFLLLYISNGILIIIIIIVGVCMKFRRYFFKQPEPNEYAEPNYQNGQDINMLPILPQRVAEQIEPIYEEIQEQDDPPYDHLEHDTDPKPISTNNHYDNHRIPEQKLKNST